MCCTAGDSAELVNIVPVPQVPTAGLLVAPAIAPTSHGARNHHTVPPRTRNRDFYFNGYAHFGEVVQPRGGLSVLTVLGGCVTNSPGLLVTKLYFHADRVQKLTRSLSQKEPHGRREYPPAIPLEGVGKLKII